MQHSDVYTFRASDGNAVKLEYRRSLPSSEQLAVEYAVAGYPDRYAVFAEKQTGTASGGGTLTNEGDRGIFLSCILRPSIFPSQAGLISALCSVALVSALDEHTSEKLEIGWPSDIYCNGKKIGVCSLKSKFDNFSTYEYLVVTFSVKIDEKNFPPRLADMMRKVFETDNVSTGMIMAKSILNRFFNMYREVKTPEKFMNFYKSRFVLEGKKIKYTDGQTKKTVKVTGIEIETGSLIAETKDGTKIKITSPSSIITPNRI